MKTEMQDHYAYHTASFAIRTALVSQYGKWLRGGSQPLKFVKNQAIAVIWGVQVKLTAGEGGMLIDGKTVERWLDKLPESAAKEALQSYNFHQSTHCTWAQAWRGYQLRYSKTVTPA